MIQTKQTISQIWWWPYST